jgi:ABC-type branched-subunit amino acid transport system permease subunit
MKKLNLFELALLSLFAGVLVSAYIAFVESSGAYLGYILNWISLKPIVDNIVAPFGHPIALSFILVILVYAVYGSLVGFIMQRNRTSKFVMISLIILIIIAATIEQLSGKQTPPMPEVQIQVTPTPQVVEKPLEPAIEEKIPEQYFGNETHGDLDSDGKDDIAFLVSRDDPERGVLYYLIAALTTEQGHVGTNLVFLGDKVEPKSLNIEKGVIEVEYMDLSTKASTTTQKMNLSLEKGVLKKVPKVEEN